MERQTGDPQADAVVPGVTEKINGIRPECDRSGGKPQNKLEKEHRGIDRQDEPQHGSVPVVIPVLVALAGMAASGAHKVLPLR
jgi:hypothetical protein